MQHDSQSCTPFPLRAQQQYSMRYTWCSYHILEYSTSRCCWSAGMHIADRTTSTGWSGHQTDFHSIRAFAIVWKYKSIRNAEKPGIRYAQDRTGRHKTLCRTCCVVNFSLARRPRPTLPQTYNPNPNANKSSTRVTKSYLSPLGTTQISSYITKH